MPTAKPMIWCVVSVAFTAFAVWTFKNNSGEVAVFGAKERAVPSGPMKQNKEKKVVFVYSYARSGSSFFGELFNMNPEILYLFEPLDAFWSKWYGTQFWNLPMDFFMDGPTLRRFQGQDETLLLEAIRKLVYFDFKALPTELLTHPAIYQSEAFRYYRSCYRRATDFRRFDSGDCKTKLKGICPDVYNRTKWDSCFHHLHSKAANVTDAVKRHDKCMDLHQQCVLRCQAELNDVISGSTAIVAKVLRAPLYILQKAMQRHGNLGVIYLVRDPRAVVLSRQKAALLSNYALRRNLLREAHALCMRMRQDARTLRQAQSLHGRHLTVTYESLVQKPNDVIKTVYRFLRLTPPASLESLVHELMTSDPVWNKTSVRYLFSTQRASKNKPVDDWRRHLVNDTMSEMNKLCGDILDKYNYHL